MSLPPDFVNELRKRFLGEIRLDRAARILYSTDASIYQIEPLGVVLPKTQEDLCAAVELAAKYKMPILPRGSGSSLAGQAVGEALILDCSRWLDSIIAIDSESQTATVEPGVVLSALNRASAKFGLTFGPDPASAERATMGGVIANNATGAHSIVYGMSADHLLSADVILADGSLETWREISLDDLERMRDGSGTSARFISACLDLREKHAQAIKQSFPKTWRNSAGYRLNYLLPWSPSVPPRWIGDEYPPVRPGTINLAKLLAGSEGTLAVIRNLTVNLVPKPKHVILGVLTYASIAEACDDVPRLLKHNPSAIELVPRLIIELARAVPAYARQMGWINGSPAAALIVEFGGDRPEVLKEAVLRLHENVIVAESAEDQARVWNVRKVGLGILDSRPRSLRPAAFIEDCAIPVERLGDFVRAVEKILSAHDTEGGIYAHASAGCLHIRPILDLKTGRGVRAMRSIAEQTLALTLRLGGSMSSEHGDGIARGEWLEQTYGDEIIGAMRALKQAADPHGLLNPKKMFDAPPMDSHLRYGADHRAQAWTPQIDFARNGGLVTAIEQCNGQGVCRKDTGVMCPSFQATREEQNSTRGRANLLRALIKTGAQQNTVENKNIQHAVYGALDLCLACKGCKAECPSGVDMAKLKFAFQAEYYKTRARPLRDYLFGYFDVVSALLAPIAPLANMLMKMDWSRKLLARLFGIAEQRPFPVYSTRRSPLRFTRTSNLPRPKIIFLPDVFSRYIEPQVEQAAFDVLTALGFEVIVLPVIGAGAALLSKGFLAAARRHAEKTLDHLKNLDPENLIPVVGIEPPEIYSMKHDYVDLLPGRADEISTRLKNVWLLDEFLVRSDNFRSLRAASKENARPKIHFQPHCHQRAEGPADDGLPNGVNATVEMLRLCGYEVELIEAGCCGMAGAFGYEAGHYALSMQVGELKLFPYLRGLKADDKTLVASTGSACRMQISQGAGIEAKHPLELAAEFLRL